MISRKIYDRIRLYNSGIGLSQCHNIIKLNSLIYNQLSSEKLISMVKYA